MLMKDVITAMFKANEIQGVLGLENSLNRVGRCNVLLVRVTSTAVVTQMLGGNQSQIIDALSQAWLVGSSQKVSQAFKKVDPGLFRRDVCQYLDRGDVVG